MSRPIADGMRAPGLQQKLDELEGRKAALESELSAAPIAAPRLMPNLAEVYRSKVITLHEALTGASGTEALEVVRGLIERVEFRPSAGGMGLEIELIGEMAAMVNLALGVVPGSGRDLFARSMKVVAGTGFEPVTFRL